MGPAIQEAINAQINRELHAGYLYLGMSAHFEAASLEGLAGWMRNQAKEEISHAMRLFDHVNERGGRVRLAPVEAPPDDFGSPLEAFRKALAHEREVTTRIHALYDLANREGDHATAVMLHWFITEQVEEEDTAGTIVDRLERIGDDPAALEMLDRELGERASG